MRNTILILGAVLFAGCMSGGPDDFAEPAPIDDGWGGPYDGVQSALLVDAREHRGAMGAVESFDGDVIETSGWSDEYWTSLEVHSAGPGWATMTILGFEGALADLEPGTVLRSSETDWSRGAQPVSMVGCSGPAQREWDFDEPTETVEVEVLPGETADARVLRFTGTFADGNTVEGEVGVELY